MVSTSSSHYTRTQKNASRNIARLARLKSTLPSAMRKHLPAVSKKFKDCWRVTDFGGDGSAESPIDLYMREKCIDRFPDAILRLASEYNVSDELKKEVNKPTFTERDATINEKDGTRPFELNEKVTEDELKVLGPNVKQEHVDALNWHSAKWIGYVKDRKVKIKHSNEHYPIFMRECLVRPAEGDKPEVKFYKIYEPLNYQKQWRFSYTPDASSLSNTSMAWLS